MKAMVSSTLAMKFGSWGETGTGSRGLALSYCLSGHWAPRGGSQRTFDTVTERRLQRPCFPRTRPPSSQDVSLLLPTHHREVGLLHLLQRDPQGLQIEDNVAGFLQP